MRKRYSKQQSKKLFDGHCFLCKEDKYELLDAHRILEGSKGGTYDFINVLTCCASCHRRIHSGEVKIDRKYTTTTGKTVLHWWLGDKEFWTEVKPCPI